MNAITSFLQGLRGPLLFATLLWWLCPAQGIAQQKYGQQVQALLSQMTLEEKVGQMTQLTLEAVSAGPSYDKLSHPHALDPAKLREAIVTHHVGSILNCAGQPHTPARWAEMISDMQRIATTQTRLHIPILYGIDAVHGANYTLGATLFPQQIGMAATWDTALVARIAEVTAYETRASSIPWTFSPVLDLGIDPRWARQWEGFGEDPYLSGEMGVAMVKGFEGNDPSRGDRVASCLKHYIGYGTPRSGKDRTPAWIPEQMLRELFLPPFQQAIDAGARSIMVNSGEVNGTPVHASHFLLTQVLRQEMGFKGLVVTDWYDIRNLVERHHVAKDYKEAVRMSVMAGIDMSMTPYEVDFARHLCALVREGAVPMSRIDEAVGRILQLKYELGLFDRPVTRPQDYPAFAGPEAQALARKAAAASVVLLKNERELLPLRKDVRLLVTGPNANSLRTLNGGWSYTWQGEKTEQYAAGARTILQALQHRLGKEQVQHVPAVEYVAGATYEQDKDTGIAQARKAARKADVILLCLGENSYTEKPGDLTGGLALSDNQLRLAQAMLATGKPVVLLLNEGRPRLISAVADGMGAVLQAFLPGSQGGEALADILLGDVNPSGKLPYTYPRQEQDLQPYYYKFSEDVPHNDGNQYDKPFVHPQYPFGYGLSYTTFAYSDLKVSQDKVAPSDMLEVSVLLTNTGKRAGEEVVQLYTTDLVASITPSVRRLRAFQKVALKPGAQQRVTFRLPASALSFVGADNRWVLEPGDFLVEVGGLKQPFAVVGQAAQ